MRVRFPNGYEAEIKDKVAEKYLKKGRVEKVNKTGPKPKEKTEKKENETA